MKIPKFVLAGWLTLAVATVLHATIGIGLQMQLGNPSNAATDTTNHSHYLISRAQYALDYNDTTREPNWVSWDLTSDDVGGSGRSNFIVDTELPAGFYQVLTTDYSGSGYDRGHMCPSADRTVTTADNQVLFTMSNMIPQAPDNNQGVWANFESYCRTLASGGNEILITSGPSGFAGSTIASGVAIPGYTWKIAVVVPLGPGSAIDRIIAAGAASIRVIAIKIPNIAGVRSTPWQNFVTSVNQIQADTGYTFFTALPAPIASALRSVVDGQSAAGSPTITSQPNPQTTVVGGSATFSVTATGNAVLNYQWTHDDAEISGATNASLTIPSVTAADVGSYYAVVTNGVGSATSNAATLTVTGLPPVVTAPPASQTVNAGANVTFAVTVTGSPTLAYQWRKGGSVIAGATNSTLTLTNVQAADATSYDVVASNSAGIATSAAALLAVNASAPIITVQPVSRTAVTAENASFTVTATGTAPLGYQWRKDGTAISDGGTISGATTRTLLISGVTAVNGGNYDVVVSNTLGSLTSAAAALTVNPPPPSNVLWDFGSTTGISTPSSGLSTDITGGNLTVVNNNGTTQLITTVSPSTGTGASGGFNAGAATINGALNKATSTYFQFTLAPGTGKRLLVTGFSFRSRSTGTGPLAYAVYSSVDGFTTALASGPLANNSNYALLTPTFSSVTGLTDTPITFRIYGSNGVGATGSTAVWRIDDLKVTLSAVFPPPVAPVVTGTSPANGATSVPVTNPLTVTFNEAVSFSGSWFGITSALNGPLTATVTGGPLTYTLATPSALANNDTVTVTILGAQVFDQASGTIHGTGNTTFAFTTESYVPPTPPTVTGQPSSQTVNVGANAAFTVSASGTAPLGYQWRKNATPISGNSSANTASLTLNSVTTADAGNYDCVVSNVAGNDISHAATLTVNVVPPSIIAQPVAQITAVGGSASFTVSVAGTAPFAYHWLRNGAPLADGGIVTGAATPTLTLTGVTDAQSANYAVTVTNPAGAATSNPAALVVTEGAPSAIFWDFATANPTSGIPAGVTGGTVTQGNNNGTTALLTTTSASSPTTTFSGGNNAGAAARIGALNKGAAGSAYFEFTFTPDAGRQFAASALTFGTRSTGTGPQAYAVFSSADGFATALATGSIVPDSVWRVITTPFAGVTGAAGAPVTFRIYGFNGTGSPAAGTANWRVDDLKLTAGLLALPPVPPTITVPPLAQTVTANDSVTFTVAASGTSPFSYQWRFGGLPITGNVSALTPTLVLPTVTTAAAGAYDCVVTNIAGTATSLPAVLVVNKAAATVTLGALNFVYNGAPAATTATTNPAGLNVIITYDGNATAPVNAGSYAVTATIDDANYTGFASDVLTISPAPAGVMLGNLTQTYTGSPLGVSASTAPGGLPVAISYEGSAVPPTNAGSYVVTGVVTDANHAGSASGMLTINKAPATVTLGDLNQIYNGTPRTVTATTVPSGLMVAVTYDDSGAAPTSAGSYHVVATVVDANYAGSTEGTLNVGKAVSAVTLGSLTQIFDGLPKLATATTTPAGLAVSFTYDGGPGAPANAGTYAVVASVDDPNYTGTASGALTITKAVATVTFSGLNQTYTGAPLGVSAQSAPAGLPVDVTYNGSATPPTNAGNYAVVGTINDANHAGTASDTLTIAKALATVTLGDLSQTYTGAPRTVTATTNPAGLPVVITYNDSPMAPTGAGSYQVNATVVDANFSGSVSGTLVVAKANAPISLTGLTQVYSGAPKTVAATTTPAGLAVNLTYSGNPAAPVNAGTYPVVAVIDDVNYMGTASSALTIEQAVAAVTLGGLSQTYDGSAKFASATTAPAGLTVSLTYNGSATAPANAGTYSVAATVSDANYTGAASGSLTIGKASATLSLTSLAQTYSGSPKPVAASTTPAGLAVSFTYDGSATPPTNAGSYAVVGTINDANFAGTASDTLTIAKALATVTIGNLSQVYNGAAKAVTATTNPAGLAVAITYNDSPTAPTGAGIYQVNATIVDANYSGSASVTLVVAKANAPIALTGLTQVYSGAPKTVTATTTPAGLTVNLTYSGNAAAPVNAGIYPVVAVIDDANYMGSAGGTLTIQKAVASVTLGGLSQTYDGAAKVASATTTPAGLTVGFTYNGSATAPANAGTYAITATVNDANYTGVATGSLTIGKATATVSLAGLAQTYNGSPRTVTATTTPTGLTVKFTYDGSATAPTNAGSYAVVGTINDANYAGSAGGTLTIAKATATVTLSGLSQTYSGATKSAAATTTPAGLAVAFTYNGNAGAPVNAGSYAVVGTVNDANYAGAASGTLVIAKAVAPVTFTNLSQIYDGTPKSVTVTTAPAGLAVSTTYNGSATAPTNVGSYAVATTVNDPNYTGSATDTLVITNATATITLSNLVQGYTGDPRPVTVTTTPLNLAVTVTYNGSAPVPKYPGSYAVVATITAPNYAGTANGTLTITATAIVRHAPTLSGGIDGSLQVTLPESTTLNGGALITGDLLMPGTPSVVLNGHPSFGGTLDAAGSANPSSHKVTLNGNVLLGHLVRRVDALSLPVVAAPPTPTGTRDVSLNSASQSPGSFATLRDLTLNGNGITLAVPAGTYGTFTLNGNNVIKLGVAGATGPAVYNLQGLTLNGSSQVQILGPVILNLASGVSLNGSIGTSEHPDWLIIRFAAGGLTLNGNVSCDGYVVAPNGTVTINGNSTLSGGVICDRLTINGNGLLSVDNQ